MSRSPKRVLIVLAGGVVVLVLAVTAAYFLYVRPELLLLRDEDHMVTIRRNWDYAAFLKNEKGQRFFPEQLRLLLDLPPQAWECPFCGERYVYRAINVAGTRITCSYEQPQYFVMWCPREHPDGRRVFMLSDQRVHAYADSEVSWYYQMEVEDLSPEEREQENRYRAEQGLPLLEQTGGAGAQQ